MPDEVLGLGKTSVGTSEPVSSEESRPPETAAIDTIAERIIQALQNDKKITPTTWADVLRGLELVLKFRSDLSGKRKKGERDLAYEALQEFKEVMNAFSKFEPK